MMLTLEDLRKYCLSKKGTSEDFPFDFSTLTIRVCGKIFLLTDIDSVPLRINLKCDPDHAINLRSLYMQVTPGYHMNKRHWNTVMVDGSIPDKEICMMIDHSYEQVVAGLKKLLRETLR